MMRCGSIGGHDKNGSQLQRGRKVRYNFLCENGFVRYQLIRRKGRDKEDFCLFFVFN